MLIVPVYSNKDLHYRTVYRYALGNDGSVKHEFNTESGSVDAESGFSDFDPNPRDDLSKQGVDLHKDSDQETLHIATSFTNMVSERVSRSVSQ